MKKGAIAVFLIANSAATAVALVVAYMMFLTPPHQVYFQMLAIPYIMINLVLLVIVVAGLLVRWAD